MTWQEFYNQYINLEPGIVAIALRLLCAMLIGSLIGVEREYTHRPAGLRTHILVALGACVASIMGQMLFAQYGPSSDPARLSAQVITGVGFLGAGTIMKEGVNVRGLTTAASVWTVACLGIAAGFGHYALALLGMLLTLLTLTLLESFQRRLIHQHSMEERFRILAEDLEQALTHINAAKGPQITLFDMDVRPEGDCYVISFRVWFVGRKTEKRRTAFFARLAAAPGIRQVTTDADKTKV
ncbi:MAG: MgtC/SapB family protein [Ruminococcaceae bacterium]|nr:MgtC/SapB family protein [Oscillospiraceae bacterium]